MLYRALWCLESHIFESIASHQYTRRVLTERARLAHIEAKLMSEHILAPVINTTLKRNTHSVADKMYQSDELVLVRREKKTDSRNG